MGKKTLSHHKRISGGCDHLTNLNVRRYMIPDKMHPTDLKKVAEAADKPLEQPWQLGDVPGDWEEGDIVSIFF